MLQSRANQAMFNVCDVLHLFILRVSNANPVIEFLVDVDIDVLVDRRTHYGATVSPIELREVASATDETHPQGCSADDHWVTFIRIAALARRSRAGNSSSRRVR